MDAQRPDDTRTHETDFAAMWSSDGMTRSFAPTAIGLPADLPFLFSAGQHFGAYLIIRPIGKGGMGQVYEAEETDSGRRVAIKLLSRGLGDDEERERFLREGRLAASLSHPNCVYVFGTCEIQGFPVIAMELAPAGTLKDLVVPGAPLSMTKAVDAILQVVTGLEAAAAIGILHRDIKPSNCFVDTSGRVMVGDFGLSMTTLARDEATVAVAGTIMGTPGFASPEQLRGAALDVRSDIYSVGATLYYLLTGRVPFDDPNVVTMITRVASEPAPVVTAARPDVSPRLASVISKCLEKKAHDRYASYAALASALEPFRSAAITPAPLGRRFIAGWIDSNVAALLATPINMFLASQIIDVTNRVHILSSQLPTIIAPLLYYGILEGRFGCGAGKALFNLRVIDDTETAPGFRKALFRAMVYTLPANIVNLITGYFALPVRNGRSPDDPLSQAIALSGAVMTFVIWGILFSTIRRRNGYAAIHDRVTGTRVVLRPRAVEARNAALRAAAAIEPAPAGRTVRIGPYDVADDLPAGAILHPVVVEGFDTRLRRGVWLERLPEATPSLPPGRRDLGRPARTRWLSGRRDGDQCWDAYEKVEGQPLLRAITERQPWSRVRHWVADLSDEIAAGLRDGSLPVLALDRIWIGSDDRARLLDWPGPGSPPFEARSLSLDPRSPSVSFADLQRFLYGVAAGALTGTHPDLAREAPPAIPLPIPARTLLLALRDGTVPDVDALRSQADTLLRTPTAFQAHRRATQIAVCAVIPVMLPIAVLVAIKVQQRTQSSNPVAFALDACVEQLRNYEKLGSKVTRQQREDREAIEIYIAEHLRDEVDENAALARAFPALNRSRNKQYGLAALAVANHPQRSPEQIKHADEVVAKVLAASKKGFGQLTSPMLQSSIAVMMIAGSVAFIGALGLIGALFVRSGFTLRTFGAALVTKDGRQASRLRALWRALVTWSPAVVMCLILYKGPAVDHPTVAALTAQTLVLAVLVGGTIWALLHPTRGIQDRLAGTWIVPR
jgi:eukaryotic-like serine/threonine-protein kinase